MSRINVKSAVYYWTEMQHLFHDAAPQLDTFVRTNVDATRVREGLAALGYKKGSPGYTAVTHPQTPLDKAFQIYSLTLIALCKFGPETTQHEDKWEQRKVAWTLAADWLLTTEQQFKLLDKKEVRQLQKVLPEALRLQCSHELPPGPWSVFPKDRMRQSKEHDLLTNKLQNLGLNRKIRAQEALTPSGISWAEELPPLKDYGTLEYVLAVVKNLEQEQISATPQPSLF